MRRKISKSDYSESIPQFHPVNLHHKTTTPQPISKKPRHCVTRPFPGSKFPTTSPPCFARCV